MADYLAAFLKSLGIDPANHPYFWFALLIIIGIAYLRISLGKEASGIKKNITNIKDNVLVIIAHLSTASRSKLDTNLVKSMSPLTITPQGLEVLRESGFIEIMENQIYRDTICSYIYNQRPATKLDVENYSIVSFEKFMENVFMVPVKTYLYNHPDVRNSFATLAGIYVRDRYLESHPEITQ